MGDRANVKIVDRESTVYLYTHWAGSELPSTLQSALARKQRWNDGQYLAKIIFSQMVKDHEDAETGYGISSVCGDGDSRILEVNVEDQTITRKSESDPKYGSGLTPKTCTFEEFVTAPLTWGDEDDDE